MPSGPRPQAQKWGHGRTNTEDGLLWYQVKGPTGPMGNESVKKGKWSCLSPILCRGLLALTSTLPAEAASPVWASPDSVGFSPSHQERTLLGSDRVGVVGLGDALKAGNLLQGQFSQWEGGQVPPGQGHGLFPHRLALLWTTWPTCHQAVLIAPARPTCPKLQ